MWAESGEVTPRARARTVVALQNQYIHDFVTTARNIITPRYNTRFLQSYMLTALMKTRCLSIPGRVVRGRTKLTLRGSYVRAPDVASNSAIFSWSSSRETSSSSMTRVIWSFLIP